MSLINKSTKIFLAGSRGLIGSAILRELKLRGYNNIICPGREELNLLDQEKVSAFFFRTKPEAVILAAAKVGGILANSSFPADFIYENVAIQNNVIWSAHLANTHRLIFMGSSCIYPRDSAQPIRENSLLTGVLETTNKSYAIAKIAGLELVNALRKQYGRDYFSVMPTNLFGIEDNFNIETSHVVPALIRKFSEAKAKDLDTVTIWGSGTPLRELLHSDDCANAIIFLAENLTKEMLDNSHIGQSGFSHINVGSGYEISIKDLAAMIAKLVGFTGKMYFDHSKPDGTPRKLLDTSFINQMGWKPSYNLEYSLKAVIEKVKNHLNFS